MTDARVPATYRLRSLSGLRPAHVLCAWGLTSLLPGATIHFEGTWGQPVITWEGVPTALAERAAIELAARLWGLGEGPLRGIQTTTPSRSLINAVVGRDWEGVHDGGGLADPSVIRTFDLAGSARTPKGDEAEVQVPAAALTFLTGRGYTAKSVQDTWELLGATTAQEARERAESEILLLLDGTLTVVEAKPGLRFSASATMPRTTSGSEKCDVQPLLDLLALCGQMLIEPAQRTVTEAGLRKGLMWFLNPVPLSIEAVVDLHEASPSGLPWPRRSARILTEPAAKISYLAPSEPFGETNGGHRA
ncbi:MULTISPECIES: hypothetical protein [unclassified Actinomyces]|uniref:hypothetical protein n=1 Tax=unclassified Actinomyces TaxID=2609248 RepID=UPI002017AEE9|nr:MULTISPECIES: hypothetical protein [unclassified Actinomyces]MCL3777887.1 hypothetical protein [Actinomyces sp. AC-20-1]MCL3789232.1 hypothetical protein [Actinomyces sp. 187325]MCL3791585.1 hypothetical protein [Actinomyces sp. 186855]MCL3793527.1 hypothetical protein [Actinomyces sp. 217892]